MRQWTRRTYRKMVIIAAAAACSSARHAGVPKDSGIAAASTPPEILLIGTSLTAGYGLDPADAWPALLQAKIDSAHLAFHVVNAGVSGETSADALHRIEWLLSQGTPAMIVIETGANDGLRGQSIDSLRANLDAILTRLDSLRPRPAIVVAGMEALPNMGKAYATQFRQLFPAAAAAHHDVYLPFLLAGVAGVDSLNQADGLHPNARGSVLVATNVWRVLGPLLEGIRH